MEKIKNFFKEIKWYEYLFVIVALIVIIALSIYYNSHIFYILSSTLGIVGVLFLSKGNIVGILICITQLIFYSIISFLNGFYGEIVNNLCVTLILYIVNLVTWIKNLYNKNGQVKINPHITWQEIVIAISCVLALSAGMYFILDVFNTNMLFVSTLSFTFNTLAIYFLARRSFLNFVFYIFSNITNFIMWGTLIASTNDYSILITVINIAVYFLLNCYGVYNWLRTQREQNYEFKDASFDKIMKILKEN